MKFDFFLKRFEFWVHLNNELLNTRLDLDLVVILHTRQVMDMDMRMEIGTQSIAIPRTPKSLYKPPNYMGPSAFNSGTQIEMWFAKVIEVIFQESTE